MSSKMDYDVDRDEEKMSGSLDRVAVQPFVNILNLNDHVKFVESCQLKLLAIEAHLRQLYELVIDCKIENLTFRVPHWKPYLHVSLASTNEANESAAVRVTDCDPKLETLTNKNNFNLDLAHCLKCFDSNIRLNSRHLLDTLPTAKSGFLFEIDEKTMQCHVDQLYVLKREPFEIDELLEEFWTEFNLTIDDIHILTEQNKKIIEHMRQKILADSGTCRLKLQVIMYNLETKRLENYLTAPVYSRFIYDLFEENATNKYSSVKQMSEQSSESGSGSTSASATALGSGSASAAAGREIYVCSLNDMKNLRILRSSRIYGNTKGGEEMILLTSKIDRDDIQVEFFQFKNDTELSWRAWGLLDRTEVHGNCSLVLKTPPFKPPPSSPAVKEAAAKPASVSNQPTATAKASPTITRNKVYFRLYRPSTGDYSDKWVFYYSDDSNDFRFLLGDDFHRNSRLSRKPNTAKTVSKSNDDNKQAENASVGVKRKNPENQSSNETEEEMETVQEETATSGEATAKSSKKKVLKKAAGADEDRESDEYQVRMLEELVLDTPKSSSSPGAANEDDNSNMNDDEEPPKTSAPVTGAAAAVTRRNTVDQESQTNSEELGKMELPSSMSSKKAFTPSEYYQLKNNYEMCLSKMNALAERSSKSLLKLARTRSMHEFLKTQRFLLTTQDDEGNTPIHLSIMYGNFDLTAIFTEVSLTISFQNIINIRNYMQLTPLMIACYLNEIEVTEYLLEANADISISDCYGFNPIHVACKNNNLELLKVLIKHVNRNNNYSVINALSHDGYAPIHLAVLNENLDILRELLYNGKSLKINIPDKRAGYTALHHAASRQNLLNFCNLLVKNEDIDIDCRSYTGCTPLHVAVANKNYLITMLLLRYGANLNVKSDVPVHYDVDFYQKIARKNTLLKSCLDKLAERNEIKSEVIPETTTNTNANMTTNETTGESNAKGDPNAAATVFVDFTKVSQEINKTISVEMDKDQSNEDQRSRTQQHNLDALYYAQNDVWMMEIFKMKTNMVSRRLLEKILCFEKYREMYFENKGSAAMTNLKSKDSIESVLRLTRQNINNIESNRSTSLVKMSQQETESPDLGEDES